MVKTNHGFNRMHILEFLLISSIGVEGIILLLIFRIRNLIGCGMRENRTYIAISIIINVFTNMILKRIIIVVIRIIYIDFQTFKRSDFGKSRSIHIIITHIRTTSLRQPSCLIRKIPISTISGKVSIWMINRHQRTAIAGYRRAQGICPILVLRTGFHFYHRHGST